MAQRAKDTGPRDRGYHRQHRRSAPARVAAPRALAGQRASYAGSRDRRGSAEVPTAAQSKARSKHKLLSRLSRNNLIHKEDASVKF